MLVAIWTLSLSLLLLHRINSLLNHCVGIGLEIHWHSANFHPCPWLIHALRASMQGHSARMLKSELPEGLESCNSRIVWGNALFLHTLGHEASFLWSDARHCHGRCTPHCVIKRNKINRASMWCNINQYGPTACVTPCFILFFYDYKK